MESDWWYLDGGERRGPLSLPELADLFNRGDARRDTLVWQAGMAEWTRADAVAALAGLLHAAGVDTSPSSAPPPPPAHWQTAPAAAAAPAPGQADRLSADFPPLPLFGRSLLYGLAFLVVAPLPWALCWLYRWVFERVRLPGGATLRFEGQPLDVWWAIVAGPIMFWIAQRNPSLALFANLGQMALGFVIVQWLVSKLRAANENMSLEFTADFFRYFGWILLLMASFVTIVGWAWVLVYQLRWMCRHVKGTHAFDFHGVGLEILWRTLATGLASLLVIPIPWVMRWYLQWFISQFSVVRSAGVSP